MTRCDHRLLRTYELLDPDKQKLYLLALSSKLRLLWTSFQSMIYGAERKDTLVVIGIILDTDIDRSSAKVVCYEATRDYCRLTLVPTIQALLSTTFFMSESFPMLERS
jgi:hypothetical protein